MSKKERVDITALTMCVPHTDKFIVWFPRNNDVYLPLGCLALMFDKEFKHASELITKNKELFEGMVIKLEKDDKMKSGRLARLEPRSKTLTCLDLSGVLQWISLLEYSSYDDERKSYIIGMKRWLVTNGKKVLFANMQDYKNTIEWKEQRQICKQTNKMLNATLKEKILPLHSEGNSRWIFSNEAIMINKHVFGYHEKGMRDNVPLDRLFVLESSEVADHTLCHVGIIDFKERERILGELQESFETYNPQERIKKLRGNQTSILDYS